MMASAAVLLACRNQLGALFSGDREVVQLTSQAVPALAISLIGERHRQRGRGRGREQRQ